SASPLPSGGSVIRRNSESRHVLPEGHSALLEQGTSGATRGTQTPLIGTRIVSEPWMRTQLPATGQVPALLPVQQASGVPAAMHTWLGSHPLQSAKLPHCKP